MSVVIRDARPEEMPDVRDLTREAYAEFASAMAPAAWRGFSAAMEGVLRDHGASTCIVANEDGRIVGSVFLYPGGASAYDDGAPLASPEFRLLAIAPAGRGRGVGRALVDECVRRATAAGAAELGLHTSQSFRSAIRMYEGMGFVRIPERDFQPEGGELVMGYRLVLSSPMGTGQ